MLFPSSANRPGSPADAEPPSRCATAALPQQLPEDHGATRQPNNTSTELFIQLPNDATTCASDYFLLFVLLHAPTSEACRRMVWSWTSVSRLLAFLASVIRHRSDSANTLAGRPVGLGETSASQLVALDTLRPRTGAFLRTIFSPNPI